VRVILASSSPRRRDLLEQVGLRFEIIPSGVDEKSLSGDNTIERTAKGFARASALLKARDVSSRTEGNRIIIAADTIVVLGREILGKPETMARAREMLQKLSGRTHRVITGIALLKEEEKEELVSSVMTFVTFRKLQAREIESYIASGEPMDKAGAYGIQGCGALLVKEIKGCYFNVVGLPIVRLAFLLRKAGIRLL
jgi:septum formation protein